MARRRELLYERAVNQKLHEDQLREEGTAGVRTAIWAAEQKFSFGDPLPEVKGTIHTMLAADRKLFVVAESGEIHCFAEAQPASVVRHEEALPAANSSDGNAQGLLKQTGANHGLAILLGTPDLAFVETMVSQSNLNLVAIESSPQLVASTRESLVRSGLYGHRVAIRLGGPTSCELPPYLADLIVSREPVSLEELRRRSNY